MANNLKKKSKILAVGELCLYASLFKKINSEFLINPTYTKNKSNKISIADANANIFEMQITTKYYDLDVAIEVVSVSELETKFGSLNEKVDDHIIEGVFVLVSQNSPYESLSKVEPLQAYLKANENCLSVLITLEAHESDAECVKKILDTCENLVEIKINLSEETLQLENTEDGEDESEFTDLDELINLIFVQSWSNMSLKSEKTVTKKEPTIEPETNTNSNVSAQPKVLETTSKATGDDGDDDDDNEFNFENLIMNLNEMRSKASNLSFEERKKYAENVVKNFWQTMGGDESELADLDQEDEDD